MSFELASTATGGVAILDLPNELLGLVLIDIARIEPPHHLPIPRPGVYKPLERNSALGFLRLSEVCRRFRALLLSMPDLWGGAVFRLPKQPGQLALEYSQSAPLAVYIRSDYHARMGLFHSRYPSHKDLVTMAVEYTARICSLIAHDLHANDYRHIFSSQLPLLEDLDLIHTLWGYTQSPEEYVCVDAPNLRRARLEYRGKHYLSTRYNGLGLIFNLPALRSLEVVLADLGVEADLKLGWLAEILHGSPLIESISLTIEYHSSNINWEMVFGGRSAQLTHLKSLKLAGCSANNVADFQKYICTTQPANFSVAIKEHEQADILLSVKRSAPMLQNPSYNGLLVRLRRGPKACTLEVGAFSALPKPERYSCTFPEGMQEIARLSIQTNASSNCSFNWSPMMDILAEELRHNKVKQLILDVPLLDTQPLIIAMTSLPSHPVTELVLQQSCGDMVTQNLSLLSQARILPAVDTLFMKPVVFARDGSGILDMWGVFVEWLSWRAWVGLRIRRLYMLAPHYNLNAGDQRPEGTERSMYMSAVEYVDEVFIE